MVQFLLQFAAAVAAGISIGCLALFLLRALQGVEIEHPAEFDKPIPLLFRLVIPFLPGARRFAASAPCRKWSIIYAPRLWMAGYGEIFTATDFVAIRLLFLFVAFAVLALGALGGHLILPLILAILLALYPGIWLQATIKKRHLSIMKALPNVLDLLTLSVESGRDLISALQDILARRKMDDLGEELTRTFQEIQLGRKRTEALRALADRVRQLDLTSTINSIIQAEELGVSIARQLRIQGDMQRNKRFTLAEKLANEASVKIIIPVVLFILPAVFIILLGPLVLYTARLFR